VGTRQAKGVAWLLGQGAYGRLADAGRPESMADAILAALQNREETRRMAVDGQRSIRQLTDADTVINAYDKVFKEAMRR